MARPVQPFEPGDLVTHLLGDDEVFTVVHSLPHYTLVCANDGVDISYPTEELISATSDALLSQLRTLLGGK